MSIASLVAEPDGLGAFYRAVLPEQGVYTLFEGMTKRHVWCHDLDELTQQTENRSDMVDLYFATASFRGVTGRTIANALYRRAFCFDIDAGPAKVAKHGDAVYATQRDALTAVVTWCQAERLMPAWVISSGAGLHVYFLLNQDTHVADWLPVAKALKAKALADGLKIDPAVSGDPARVLRPIGSLHSNGERVSVIMNVPAVYTLAQLTRKVAKYLAPWPRVRNERSINADVLDQPIGPPKSLGKVAAGCAAMAHAMQARGNVSEPYWRAMLGVIKHTTEGEAAAHEFSDGHADYDYDATQDKLDRWTSGPALCLTFEGENPQACAGCQHRGSIKSPIVLGSPAGALILAAVTTAGLAGASATHGTTDDARPTDLALSVIWVRRNGDRFGYDHSRKLWMTFEGGTWIYCSKGQQVEAAKDLADALMKDATAALSRDRDSKRAQLFMACAIRAQSAAGTQAALSLAQSDPAIATSFEEFDQDPDLFNVANGVIHLPTGELLPHDPAKMQHRQSPVTYDPQAKCPNVLTFLEQVSCNDPTWVDYMWKVLGYAMSGHTTEERMWFWLGAGANGKSVWANVVRNVMGTYAATAPTAFLMQAKRDPGGATPELAMLPGVRMLSANEVEAGAKLSAQTLKAVVSTEHLAARPLYGAPFSFKPVAKMFVRGNHRPIITDDDEGIWRRIDLIPFDLKLAPDQRDTGLEARLLAEAPGILRLMVEGFARWRLYGLMPPKRIRDASLAYRKESDVLGQWIDECCDTGHGFDVPQRVAYSGHQDWSRDQGLRQISKKSFTRSLRERGIDERRQSTGARLDTYTGIRLKP